MPTSYCYRLLNGATWGIAIDVRGETVPLPTTPSPPGVENVAEGLWLLADVGWPLTEEETGFLRLGLRLVAGEIAKQGREGAQTLVRITALDFDPHDYQPDGLAAAVAEWAAQDLGFPKPEIPVTFDRGRNRYVFSFNRADWRPAQSASAGS